MNVDHPYLLAVAVLPTIPFLFPLARFFFDGFDQFVEDLGLTGKGQWLFLVDFLHPFNTRYSQLGVRGAFLNIIGFLVVWAALVAAAYHLLVFLASYIG